MVLGMDVWDRHPDVRLDADVAEYRRLLRGWLERRKEADKHVVHFSQLPDALGWPLLPGFPAVHDLEPRVAHMRQEMILRGAEFLMWQRPGSRELPLPRGQRLLATGDVVEDNAGTEEIMSDDGDDVGGDNVLGDGLDEWGR